MAGAQPVPGKPEPGAAVDQRVGYGVGPLAAELVSKPAGRVRRRRQRARVPVLFVVVVDERLEALVAVERERERVNSESMRKRFLPSVSVLWGGEGVEGADGTPLRVVGEGATPPSRPCCRRGRPGEGISWLESQCRGRRGVVCRT
jgi:hypothetical protein